MNFQVDNAELERWVARKRAIEDIEPREGFQILVSRIKQEYEAANDELMRCSRWNWFRILKALIRRDANLAILQYIDGVKREGEKAEDILGKRDPVWARENKRAVFFGSKIGTN